MKPLWRVCVLAGCAAMLAACVSVPRRAAVPVGALSQARVDDAQARQAVREARVAAAATLSFSGRVALSNGRNGGSGRLEWTQTGDRYDVTLAAPVTRQSWRLTGDPSGARIEGIEGGPREDRDVSALLRETTGQDIPVGALAAWAAGARADPVRFGPATLSFADDGRLAHLEQGGWSIDYLGWGADAAGSPAGADRGLELPNRIDARRGDSKVRLAIDMWSLAPASP